MPISQESNIQMAISAYNSKKKKKKFKSKKQAAKVFGVSETTLRERLKGRKPRTETHANNHILSSIQEEVLVKQVLNADKCGFQFVWSSYVKWLKYCFISPTLTLTLLQLFELRLVHVSVDREAEQ